MDYKPEWTDDKFLVASIMDAVFGLSLADHGVDAMNEAIDLSGLVDPKRMRDTPIKGEQMSARERHERYRQIVTPIMADLPCFAWWHGEPLDEEDAECKLEEWDWGPCPTCQARERMMKPDSE